MRLIHLFISPTERNDARGQLPNTWVVNAYDTAMILFWDVFWYVRMVFLLFS